MLTITELTSPMHYIPHGSVTSPKWANAALTMDSALSMARAACAAYRRHPEEHGAREHALEKLLVAEQAIIAALADPDRYDAQMLQVRLAACCL